MPEDLSGAIPYGQLVSACTTDFSNNFQRSLGPWYTGAGLGILRASCGSAPGLILVVAGLGSQPELSHMPLGSALAATNHRSLCNSYWVSLDQAEEAADLGLHRSPF